MAEDTGLKDTPTAIDKIARIVAAYGEEKLQEGWQSCLRMVRSSVEGYPDHGGDQAIMEAIQKIEDAAFTAGGNAVHE